jgi:hypothetical protein
MGRMERNDGWRREPFIQEGTAERVRGGIGRFRVSTEGAITYSAIHFCVSFPICFSFYWLSYSTSGASSPDWVQPTAEGGGLSRICFRVNVLAFRDLFSSLCLLCICLHTHHG